MPNPSFPWKNGWTVLGNEDLQAWQAKAACTVARAWKHAYL